ncbi:MAG: cysteine synthase family protein [Lentisphaeria bacterium]|jgi:cysteine synthase A|nr:cysteine synthase family protein [Lentisphaeria bacterium]
MSQILHSILEAVGNTPLVELQRMTSPGDARILVKVEGLNVGGSIKTRTALNMLEAAERAGTIGPGAVIIEPTSGNQGIGLALVCCLKGYRCIIVMPDSVSIERLSLMRLYGAETVIIPDHDNIGECMARCLAKAYELREQTPGGFVPQQFENPHNPEVHHDKTGQEILAQLGAERVDAFCSGFGTGGTLSGIGTVLRERFPEMLIVAVEPENAAILAGGAIGSHLQMGIGDGFIPKNLNTGLIDENLIITDDEALRVARDLARREGLPAGISSGTNVAAALRLARRLGVGRTVLTVLPDSYDRYYSTPLFA